MAARRLSRFNLEIGEGDAATGKGDTVLLAAAVLLKLRFLGKRSGEAHLALGATAGPAGVIHFDSVGFRQFQEGHGLVRLDRPVALMKWTRCRGSDSTSGFGTRLPPPATRLDPKLSL